MLSSQDSLFVFKFFAGDLDIKSLESWVYDNLELDENLASDDYLDLISINFNHASASYDATKILARNIDLCDYVTWKLKRTMNRIIERSENVHIDISETYDLYCRGYSFLSKMAFDYGLTVDCPPPSYEGWYKLSSAEQSNLIDSFYPNIVTDARQVLMTLERHDIKFLKVEDISILDGMPRYPEFIDTWKGPTTRNKNINSSRRQNRITIAVSKIIGRFLPREK